MGRRSYFARSCSQGRQVLGSRVSNRKGPRTMGRRAAQHVETNPAGGALVSWRQPAPVETLFLVPGSSTQGPNGRDPDSGLRASGSSPPELALPLADTVRHDMVGRGGL